MAQEASREEVSQKEGGFFLVSRSQAVNATGILNQVGQPTNANIRNRIMTEEKKYTGLNCPAYKIRVLTRRIESSVREFLDVSSSTGHLEVYRQDLNDLMNKFIEANREGEE